MMAEVASGASEGDRLILRGEQRRQDDGVKARNRRRGKRRSSKVPLISMLAQ